MKKIMIVDDSLFMRSVLKDVLPEKYKVIEAESGSTALEQFKNENPDLILLDIVMPTNEQEGINVLKTIMKTNPDAIVIMVTAVGQDTVIEECEKLGARGYIIKPFDKKQVVETVEKYLEGKED